MIDSPCVEGSTVPQRERLPLKKYFASTFAIVLLGSALVSPAWAQFFEQEIDLDKLFSEGTSNRGKTLVLAGKKIGDQGVKVLASHEVLKNVVKLDLRYNEITAQGAQYLVESPHAGKLQSLELRHNDLSDGGAEAIANSKNFPSLAKLMLGWNEIHDPGGMAIANSGELIKKLKKLDLRGNFLADATKKALKKSFPHIKTLSQL